MAVGTALPWLAIGLILKLATNIENTYVTMVFETMLPLLGTGMSLFFVADWANEKLGLLKVDSSEVHESASVSSEQLVKSRNTESLNASYSEDITEEH